MKKLILIFYCMISCYSSCRSGDCSDPNECKSPDRTTTMKAIISHFDSVLYMGDTLRFYTRVPDTLITKELPIDGRAFTNQSETIFVKSFYKKRESYMIVELKYGDTLGYNGIMFKALQSYESVRRRLVKHGFTGNASSIYVPFTKDTREFECYFILPQPGLYLLMVKGSFFGITDKDKRDWMLLPVYNYFDKNGNYIKRRTGQYLKYTDAINRTDALKTVNEREGRSWYCFEVKP